MYLETFQEWETRDSQKKITFENEERYLIELELLRLLGQEQQDVNRINKLQTQLLRNDFGEN